MLYLCLTADYELYFGKNLYPENEVLFKPTKELLDVAKSKNVKVTLMADILSVFRYREYGMDDYPDEFENQLKYAVAQGHDVQLHIHPHWLNSVYSVGSWVFDKKLYKVHDLGFETNMKLKNSANDVIIKGKNYLDNLLKPINNKYECIAFRAGGWCIQPETELLRVLKSAGINIDTTIYKDGYLKSDTHFFDFRKVASNACFWVNPKYGLGKNDKYDLRNIFEVCIGSYTEKPNLYYYKLLNRLSKAPRTQNTLRGLSIGFDNTNSDNYINKILSRIHGFVKTPIILSLEGNHIHTIQKIIEYYVKRYKCESNDIYVSIITHPKSLYSNDFSRLRKIIDYIGEYYGNVIEFVTMLDINKKLFVDENSNVKPIKFRID